MKKHRLKFFSSEFIEGSHPSLADFLAGTYLKQWLLILDNARVIKVSGY